MRKLMLFLLTLLLCFSMKEIAYAGNINEQEQALIEAACEVYEYDGYSYKADQKYIDKLIDYLSQDDIDITAEDKDLLIQIAYANIELGIKDGYLKPVDDLNKQEEQNSMVETNAEDTIREALEYVGMDISDVESYIPSFIYEADNSEKPKDTSYDTVSNQDDSNINTSQVPDEHNSVNDIDTTYKTPNTDSINTTNSTSSIATDTTDIENTTANTDMAYNTPNQATGIESTTPDIAKDTTDTTYITDTTDNAINNVNTENITSINLERVLLIMIGLVVLILVCIFIIKRNKYQYHAYKQGIKS